MPPSTCVWWSRRSDGIAGRLEGSAELRAWGRWCGESAARRVCFVATASVLAEANRAERTDKIGFVQRRRQQIIWKIWAKWAKYGFFVWCDYTERRFAGSWSRRWENRDRKVAWEAPFARPLVVQLKERFWRGRRSTRRAGQSGGRLSWWLVGGTGIGRAQGAGGGDALVEFLGK